jgi:quinol monooxygenase YgiN
MHIAILNFHLKNTTPEQFKKQCDELAPALAQIPGLVSKVWLADSTANTYGGVYTWKDRAAFQAFAQSDLAKAMLNNPSLADVTIRDFAVMEGPTKVTRGLAA